MQPRLLDELSAHHQVVVKEPPRILLIVANAADNRGEVYDQIRLGLFEQPLDCSFFHQIEFLTARHEYFDLRKNAELFNEKFSQEAGAAGDNDFSVREV